MQLAALNTAAATLLTYRTCTASISDTHQTLLQSSTLFEATLRWCPCSMPGCNRSSPCCCRHEVHAGLFEVIGHKGLQASAAGCLWLRHQDARHTMLLPGAAPSHTSHAQCLLRPRSAALLCCQILDKIEADVLFVSRFPNNS